MRRAILALRRDLWTLARAIDVEGAFVIAGTAILASGAGAISPAGPYFVVGTVLLLLGFALARPVKKP